MTDNIIWHTDFLARREREAAELMALEITNVSLLCEQFPATWPDAAWPDTAPAETKDPA